MSDDASINRHVYDLAVSTEVHCGISREQGSWPDAIVNPTPLQSEIETQLVIDRLLRECFTPKSRRGTAKLTHPDDPEEIQGPRISLGAR